MAGRPAGRIGTALRAEHMRRGHGQIESQSRRQITASDSTNTVGTEEMAHEVTLPAASYLPDNYEDAQRPRPEYQDIRERALRAPG